MLETRFTYTCIASLVAGRNRLKTAADIMVRGRVGTRIIREMDIR